MEFLTKTVISRKNKKAYVAYAGLLIAISSLILVFIPPLEDYIPWVFGAGIVVVVIGAIIARGDITDYGLGEDDIAVSVKGIAIGSQVYPMNQIRKLDFDVQAYEGMYVNDGAMISGANSDGMTNRLSFEVNGKTIEAGFYLGSAQHVQLLGVVFNEFYELHIPFIEHNKSTRTFMFQYLKGKELEEFKKKYGY